MLNGPVGPVEVFFTGPKPFWEFFTGLGAIGPLLASSPAVLCLLGIMHLWM